MLRNYLAAALGNMSRQGLYAGITILGLAVSFAAAILLGLYVRDEYSFDRFIPSHERVYRLQDDLLLPGQKPWPIDVVQATAAANLKLDFPEIEHIARLGVSRGLVKIGAAVTDQWFAWVDPDFFKVLPFKVLAGDANAAAASTDGLVLTREMARKYFGEDAPIGRTLLLNPGMEGDVGLPPGELQMVSTYHPMKVMAVLDDPPSSSHLTAGVFASALAPFSATSVEDRHSSPTSQNQLAYLKLKPGVSPKHWAGRLKAFGDRRYPGVAGAPPGNRFWLTPLDSLHFTATGVGPTSLVRPTGDRRVDVAIAAVGALVVAIAAINFVTLMTARATRRAVEVGVRKAVGASRRALIVQFMGEALIYVAIAMLIAVVAVELALPRVNAFLQRSLVFDYLGDPALVGVLVAAALLTTACAGVYPSLVLSGFRPAAVLKGGGGLSSGSVGVRQILVVMQFAILIGLIFMTATIYRQTQFVLNDALRLDTDQVMIVGAPCASSFEQEARGVAGVKGVACASSKALQLGDTDETSVIMPDRSVKVLYDAQAGVGFFELHGLKPAAGRFFAKSHGEDVVLDRPNPPADVQPSIILNETGARFLGFANPAAAVGKTVNWARASPGQSHAGFPPHRPSQVIGIVPDFTLGSARTAVRPTMFYVDARLSQALVVKLDRGRIPETLESLRRLWRQTGHDRPAPFIFESQAIQSLYQDVITQGVTIAVCAGLAVIIACLGLFALAAFVTERRTKEIGVRKAMGAGAAEVMRLLLWQFTQPVLWANLIAWPIAFWAMDYWLHGFAYRVDQPPWMFLAASAIAAVIAWATVCTHSWMAARARPATALRSE